MNSYPAELLVQLAPVMFVAGLEQRPPPTPQSASSPTAMESLPNTLTTPSARRRDTADQFETLMRRLREMLVAQRKSAVWVPENVRKSKTFQVVLVDEIVQFPPRKVPIPRNPAEPNASYPPRSPLSPLHPSSPLHPDGLIAPIWIRKHTNLVPSVFVLFLRLFENDAPLSTTRSPLDAIHPDVQLELEEREKEDRKHDERLSHKISERKKATSERGMKLTVVLLASRRMLDDPGLDARLTFIRRTSGLDSRAALFVLSPVSPAELTEFVKSIQQALYDPAIEYYTSHSKRVRRKRNRHSQVSSASYGLSGKIAPRALPLRPEGWTTRYEYKMACFAEFRGEEEVALKHYQDSYTSLLSMFNSAAMLAPRTKRWAEAKVLADSINIKICKLFLYNQEHALALSQFNTHVRKFSELSIRAWAIGEDTFEYWSWIARQFRVLSELLEQGTHYSLAIPQYLPPAPPPPLAGQSQQEIDALQALGLNPNVALMHPGFYYYIAAECTERRRACFLQAAEAGMTDAPGFQNETKVDHLGSILELYTKAYELFKKHGPSSTSQNHLQSRFTLWIAYRIANTYYESEKYDMAIKFFERISHTYSREKWGSVLQSLFTTWYACAQKLGDMEMSIRLLIQKIAKCPPSFVGSEGDSPEEDLRAILQSTVPTSNEPTVIDLSDNPLFDSYAIFWASDIKLEEKIAFQIYLSPPDHIDLSRLPITSVGFSFAQDCGTIRIECDNNADEKERLSDDGVQLLDVGSVLLPETKEHSVRSYINWGAGQSIVIYGTVQANTATELKIGRCEIRLQEMSWDVRLSFDVRRLNKQSAAAPRWWTKSSDGLVCSIPIRRGSASSCLVKPRPHEISIKLSHAATAYLDEPYPITVDVTNEDDRDLLFTMDALLQPGEDNTANSMEIDDQQSAALIKGISMGVLGPGVTASKIVRLKSTGMGGDRLIDFSIQSHLPQREDATLAKDTSPLSERCELLRTLVIPTVPPFEVKHETTYSRHDGRAPGPAYLGLYDSDFWDDADGGKATIISTLECVDRNEAGTIVFDRMQLLPTQAPFSRVVNCSLEDESFPIELFPGDQFCVVTEISLAPPDEWSLDTGMRFDRPADISIDWRRSNTPGSYGSKASTSLKLPMLSPPLNGTTALLNTPPLAHLHQPFTLELLIRNQHPTRTVFPKVHLELSASESFVVAGIRSGRLAALIPGAEDKIVWQLIPLECGPAVPLPLIKLTDSRRTQEIADSQAMDVPLEASADVIRIIPLHLDKRLEDGSDTTLPLGADKVTGDRFRIAVSPA